MREIGTRHWPEAESHVKKAIETSTGNLLGKNGNTGLENAVVDEFHRCELHKPECKSLKHLFFPDLLAGR